MLFENRDTPPSQHLRQIRGQSLSEKTQEAGSEPPSAVCRVFQTRPVDLRWPQHLLTLRFRGCPQSRVCPSTPTRSLQKPEQQGKGLRVLSIGEPPCGVGCQTRLGPTGSTPLLLRCLCLATEGPPLFAGAFLLGSMTRLFKSRRLREPPALAQTGGLEVRLSSEKSKSFSCLWEGERPSSWFQMGSQ